MKVKLSPEGMGDVSIKVKMVNGQVNIEMVTSNDEAKKILEIGLGEMKVKHKPVPGRGIEVVSWNTAVRGRFYWIEWRVKNFGYQVRRVTPIYGTEDARYDLMEVRDIRKSALEAAIRFMNTTPATTGGEGK